MTIARAEQHIEVLLTADWKPSDTGCRRSITKRQGAADGGLMSYGADVADLFRRGAPDYVNRILRGAKPNELPVQFSTKFAPQHAASVGGG